VLIVGKPTELDGVSFHSSWKLINALMTFMKHKGKNNLLDMVKIIEYKYKLYNITYDMETNCLP
jgi:hypothetical protein